MIPHAFGESSEWTVGIEEELFVVDARTLEPTPVPAGIIDGKRLKAELFASVVELNTGVCTSVEQAAEELDALRREAKRRLGRAGCSLAGAATWPPALAEEQAVTPEDGYLRFVEYAGPSARRQFCSGLHVHVGVPSAEACMTALEAVLPWLPLVLAVSANSPYLGGRETGLASNRAELLALLPRSAAPPVFASYGEWERFAERLVELGLADEWTRIWWDVRPHPRFGTLELRMPDQPTRLAVTVAFAALLQALVATAAEGAPADRGIYEQNRWAALRFGRSADLIHPVELRIVGVGDLLAEVRERLLATTERLGTTALLAPLEALAQADEQVELGRSEGLRSLCERLVVLT
ncbi:MAG: YbdK family carboxylate-amine ligase [Actinomycetota bacterium]|nr:YbdK family carboxylate-amine ligase [Actinomycetota bacterium]